MLNLLAFQPGKKEQYLKYSKTLAQSVGSRRGGMAKLVGNLVPNSCSDGCSEWEEVCMLSFQVVVSNRLTKSARIVCSGSLP